MSVYHREFAPDYLSSPEVYPRSNLALHSNRPIANNNITTHGSDWMWAVCALHGIILLGVIGWTYATDSRKRVFHYISIAILLVASIYYYIMASDLGGYAVPVEFRHDGLVRRTRQVFYTRWVGYFINFSLAFFALLLLSGVGWASILFTIGLTMLWATMFLIGEFVSSSYKWGFFVFAICLYFFICWQTLGIARRYAYRVDPEVHKTFAGLTAYLLFFMALYPISWGLSEGGNVIKNDSECVFYGILDVFSQGLFAAALLFTTQRLDFDRLQLSFSEYGRIKDRVREVIHEEKVMHGQGNGVRDGPADGPAAGNAGNGYPAPENEPGVLRGV
ncbi:hypothetical protein RUND412_008693 [Rhizina undulata]